MWANSGLWLARIAHPSLLEQVEDRVAVFLVHNGASTNISGNPYNDEALPWSVTGVILVLLNLVGSDFTDHHLDV